MGAGGGWVRAVVPALSGALTLGLLLHRTDLQKQAERGELLQPLVFASLVLCSVLLYLRVSLMDPGFVKPEEELEADKSEEQSMVTHEVPNAVRMRRCGYCMVKVGFQNMLEKDGGAICRLTVFGNISVHLVSPVFFCPICVAHCFGDMAALQPMRAKHCQQCQHCVRRYDHHCPWIENCVGEKNHPLFIAYLSVQLIVLLWGGHIAWSGLYFDQSWDWLKRYFLLLTSFLLIVVFTIVALLLLISQLYLISCNTTTWEFMSHHRISYLRHSELENPFDQGVILNLWRFFCSSHLTAWEKVYFHRTNELV